MNMAEIKLPHLLTEEEERNILREINELCAQRYEISKRIRLLCKLIDNYD